MNKKYKWIVLWEIESKYFIFDNKEDFEEFIFDLKKDELNEFTIIKQPNNIIYAEDYIKNNIDYVDILNEQVLGNHIVQVDHSEDDAPFNFQIGNIIFHSPLYSDDENHLVDYNAYIQLNDKASCEIGFSLLGALVLKDNCWILNTVCENFENPASLDKELMAAWLLQEMGFVENVVEIVTDPKPHEENQFYHSFGFVPVFKKDIKEPKVKQISLDIELYGDESIDDVYNDLERYIAQQDGYKLLNTYHNPTDLTKEYKEAGAI